MPIDYFALPRRGVLALGAASLAGLPALGWAQVGGPIKLQLPFSAGGSSDQTARLLAEQLRDSLGRPVLVENRTGAGGQLMLDYVKSAKPDGDTLAFVAHGQMTLFQHIYKSLRFDAFKDFVPVARVCSFEFALTVAANSPARTLADFIAWARDPANKAAYATPGSGTVPHFIGALFGKRAGLQLTAAPYRGAAPGLADLMGGSISMAVTPVADVLQYAKAGRLRVLATTGEKRSAFMPDVPTLKESGIDEVVDGWYGVFAPAGTPQAVVARLGTAIQQAAHALKDPLAKMALRVDVSTSAALAEQQRRESVYWSQAVKATGFTPQD